MKLWRTDPASVAAAIEDDEGPIDFAEVTYDAERKVWLSKFMTEAMATRVHVHEDLLPMSGTFRLAGGADHHGVGQA